MFNPTQIVINEFVEHIQNSYHNTYGRLDNGYPEIVAFVARLSLENIANSDAAYHDVMHTLMVTDVGLEILRGKHILHGGVSTKDWLHFMISLLCHDIGYVRGVCRGDKHGHYVKDIEGNLITLEPGATDAALTPYHVARSKLFIRERFGHVKIINANVIEANIEHTSFPVPQDEVHKTTSDYPGLLRAADLVGQLADLNYMRKISALFNEFRETGANDKLGYKTPADLRAGYPGFFWNMVNPYIQDSIQLLNVTQEGKQWVSNLYAHVFAEEHKVHSLGAERGSGRANW